MRPGVNSEDKKNVVKNLKDGGPSFKVTILNIIWILYQIPDHLLNFLNLKFNKDLINF